MSTKSSFTYVMTPEERKQRQEELKPGFIIHADDTMKMIRYVIKNMEKSDVCFSMIHDVMDICRFNNEEMNGQMRLWKDLAKQKKITVLECNNKTREIDGKKFYLMTVTPNPNDAMVDPIGMALKYMVSGYIYVFRQEKNRDAVFNYVKKFC